MQPELTDHLPTDSPSPFPLFVLAGSLAAAAPVSVAVAIGYSVWEYHWYEGQGIRDAPVSPLISVLVVAAGVFLVLAIIAFFLGIRRKARRDRGHRRDSAERNEANGQDPDTR